MIVDFDADPPLATVGGNQPDALIMFELEEDIGRHSDGDCAWALVQVTS